MGELQLQQCRVDNRYDIVERLGHGSYAEIYVANDIAAVPPAATQVVLKALDLYLQGTPDQELERTLVENFQNEAVALDRVRHPHIINRLGHGTAIDLAGKVFHYIVLEYMPGGDLAALCRQRALSIDRTLNYLQQVCAGLDHAHSRGVIHRDIKPQNLLLSRDLAVIKIADFGVAKLEASDEIITRVGTDVYAAPEHHPLLHTGPLDPATSSQKRCLTPAADVYSLAKTTYMLLTGESPRRFAQQPITSFPPTTEHYFWAAPVLEVLRQATDSQVEKRFQSAHEFFGELREASLAPTRLLDEQTTIPSPIVNQLRPVAPPAPVFSPTEVASQHFSADIRSPRIVVPFDSSRREEFEMLRAAPHQSAQAPTAVPELKPVRAAAAPRRFLRNVWLPLVLILCLSGVLLATHAYFGRRSTAVSNAETDSPFAGRVAVAKTDINLRPTPSRNNQALGRVEWKSRVRILQTRGNWAEIEILERGRISRDSSTSDRGWVDRSYLDLQ